MPKTTKEICDSVIKRTKLNIFNEVMEEKEYLKFIWYSEKEFNEERLAKERFHKLAFDKEHECEKLRCKIEEMKKII